MMILGHAAYVGPSGHRAGRRLLGRLYLTRLGRPMPPIRIGAKGKPRFVGGGVHFSISHTKGHVFCVLSPYPVGLDAELSTRQIPPRLAEKILSPGEFSQYAQAENPEEALREFWVLKEAGAKATGQGLTGYPRDTDFTLGNTIKSHGCTVAIIRRRHHAV